MKVQDIMSKRVVTVELDDRLHVVKTIFDTTRFHHLLVIDDDGSLYGVVSDRDLLRALSPFIGSTVETARFAGRGHAEQGRASDHVAQADHLGARGFRGRCDQPLHGASGVLHSHRRRAVQAGGHRQLAGRAEIVCWRYALIERFKALRRASARERAQQLHRDVLGTGELNLAGQA